MTFCYRGLDMIHRKPKVLSSKIVHKNPWYQVRRDRLIWPNGAPGDYFVMENPDAAIVIVENKNKLLTVEQYRYPTDHISLEFCMGALENKEGIIKGAQRELLEETGYEAKRLQKIGSFDVMNGVIRHQMHVLVAKGLTPKKHPNRETSEYDLRIKWIPIKTWRTLIAKGKIRDAASLSAWTIYQEWKTTKKDSP